MTHQNLRGTPHFRAEGDRSASFAGNSAMFPLELAICQSTSNMKFDLEKAVELYKSGLSGPEVNKALGNPIRDDSMCRALRKHCDIRRRSHSLNETFFEELNPISLYWLGLVFADGCIRDGRHVLSFSVCPKDLHHIELLRSDLRSSHPIHPFKVRSFGREYDAFSFAVYSKSLVDRLKALGVEERKSLTMTFPKYLSSPSEAFWHFVRGYFDGDGFISVKGGQVRMGIVGTMSFLESVSSIAEPAVGEKGSISFGDGIYCLRYSRINTVIRFGELMYKDATRFLKRKRRIFESLEVAWRNQ